MLIGTRIASTAFWAFLIISSVVLFPVAVLVWAVTAPFDSRKVVLHRFTCFWASLYSWLNPAWPVTVTGREKVKHDETYVMVANHESLVDILVLFRLFRHFKWVSKIENFRLPFIGWNMSLNGYIKLRRGDRESVMKMLEACRQTLAQGNSIMMFPEGTRSTTGEMRPFKPGAFELALDMGKPILPITLQGSANALPKRGFLIRDKHPIQIAVLDPVPFESFQHLSPEEVAEQVRSLIATELAKPTGTPSRSKATKTLPATPAA